MSSPAAVALLLAWACKGWVLGDRSGLSSTTRSPRRIRQRHIVYSPKVRVFSAALARDQHQEPGIRGPRAETVREKLHENLDVAQADLTDTAR